jgi:hypothetical protein
MKELLPKGAIQKTHFLVGTWTDNALAQCMYTTSQIWAWSLPHLKGGSWYLDSSKGFCPLEEEAEKTAIDSKDAIRVALALKPLDP